MYCLEDEKPHSLQSNLVNQNGQTPPLTHEQRWSLAATLPKANKEDMHFKSKVHIDIYKVYIYTYAYTYPCT